MTSTLCFAAVGAEGANRDDVSGTGDYEDAAGGCAGGAGGAAGGVVAGDGV